MNTKSQTIDTYNRSAQALADKFNKQGARIADIREMLDMLPMRNPFVLEIGCGNGRDAAEILKRTDRYVGIDVSAGLLQIARRHVPQARFELADVETYVFPADIDIVCAFASLLHVPRESMISILERIKEMLSAGGLVRISLKYSPTYKEVTTTDEFGTRTYYLYSQEDIASMAKGFQIVMNEIREVRGVQWLEVILKKT